MPTITPIAKDSPKTEINKIINTRSDSYFILSGVNKLVGRGSDSLVFTGSDSLVFTGSDSLVFTLVTLIMTY